ncbi:MAG: PH domain-containing protein [Geodermatophilaceae bacterium]
MGADITTSRLRMPRSAWLAVGIFVVCTIPLVSVSPWLLILLVLPVLAGVHVWRSGVDIGQDGVRVHAVLGSAKVPWADIAGVEIRRRGELWLVRREGGAFRLPTLRLRDIHRLHAASGGRLGLPADA